MSDNLDYYKSPFGYSGTGLDIKWCKRWSGGKFCMYCRHYAKFKEWSTNWHWYYLLEWLDPNYGFWKEKEYAHYKVTSFRNTFYLSGTKSWQKKEPNKPNRYRTVGIKETDLKALLRRGCRKKRKCRCVSIAQRGSWYCPECYYILTRAANNRKVHFHDITIMDRNELKEEILISLLSGTL